MASWLSGLVGQVYNKKWSLLLRGAASTWPVKTPETQFLGAELDDSFQAEVEICWHIILHYITFIYSTLTNKCHMKECVPQTNENL